MTDPYLTRADPLRATRAARLLLLLGTLGLSCGPALAAVPDTPEVAAALEARLAPAEHPPRAAPDHPLATAPLLRALYQSRGFRPLWTGEGQVEQLLALVAESESHGLTPADYHLEALRALITRAEVEVGAAAELDLLASDALAGLALHLRFGKVDPERLEPAWNYSREVGTEDPAAWLAETAGAVDLARRLEALHPQGRVYRGLREALARLRAVAQAGGWPVLPAGPSLKPGAEDDRVVLLRRRLAAGGELAEAGEGRVYDPSLEQAVRVFQGLHGLAQDGVVGPRTLAALNVPVQARIDQLRVNLERLRWVFRDLEREFVVVNIAAFQAAYLRDGAVLWSARAIVGRPYRRTPVFKARLERLVLNPAWVVPPTILAQDILPLQRREAGYLAGRGIRVIDQRGEEVDPALVDWDSGGRFPYLLRQDPGPDNALGRVKFLFPNPYMVYMHDTPARELFERAERSFSSGCIRIERPLELAELLLRDPVNWTRTQLEARIAEGRTQSVPLPQPVTIMLLYLTAFTDQEGNTEFRADIYDRDRAVLQALDGPVLLSAPRGHAPGARAQP